MLKPSADDPNRAKEIERMKQNPEAFGSDIAAMPKDWSESPLTADKEESQSDQPKKRGRPAKS